MLTATPSLQDVSSLPVCTHWAAKHPEIQGLLALQSLLMQRAL